MSLLCGSSVLSTHRYVQTRVDVECARPGRQLAQVWPKWAVKVTMYRPIINGDEF